jgi:hypothetical protein
METTVYMSLTMNNMAGVVQEAGTANLSEAPECCCSMFLFSFLCDVGICLLVPYSVFVPEFPVL